MPNSQVEPGNDWIPVGQGPSGYIVEHDTSLDVVHVEASGATLAPRTVREAITPSEYKRLWLNLQ